jgi:hypothetical protein
VRLLSLTKISGAAAGLAQRYEAACGIFQLADQGIVYALGLLKTQLALCAKPGCGIEHMRYNGEKHLLTDTAAAQSIVLVSSLLDGGSPILFRQEQPLVRGEQIIDPLELTSMRVDRQQMVAIRVRVRSNHQSIL